jgi:ArsR family transcriptional regulator, arsenate/arsenite/antimonite-responsive transcriptional repressor
MFETFSIFHRIDTIRGLHIMPIIKTDQFKKPDVRLAEIAKALSHPARIAILKELARRNECVCGQIVDAIPLAQSTVSQHLKELKKIGMIRGEIDGPRSCYCIDGKKMAEVAALLGDFLQTVSSDCQDKKC